MRENLDGGRVMVNGVKTRVVKPLGGKAYGSIPHLPGSKYGNRDDKGVPPAMAKYFTMKPRRGDVVFVTEKLDGCCVAVAKICDELVALTRSGVPCNASRYEHHKLFSWWVAENYDMFYDLLEEGERVCGEWLALAHGTRYNLDGRSPFAAFDIMRGATRIGYKSFYSRCSESGVPTVPLIREEATRGVTVCEALSILGKHGFYGAERPEGAVWRIERDNKPIMLAKYVCPYTNPGCLLPEISGGEPVWNWRPCTPYKLPSTPILSGSDE